MYICFAVPLSNMTIERDDDDRRKKKYPLIYDDYQSSDYPGLYFAGTNTHSLDFRKSAGGFIHGFRYTGTAHTASDTQVQHTRLQIHRYSTHVFRYTGTAHTASDTQVQHTYGFRYTGTAHTASDTHVQLQLQLVDTVLTKI